MAEQNTRPLSPKHLQDDLDAYAALKGISGYTPSNPDFAFAKGTAATIDRFVKSNHGGEPRNPTAWLSASHVEKVPMKKETPTP